MTIVTVGAITLDTASAKQDRGHTTGPRSGSSTTQWECRRRLQPRGALRRKQRAHSSRSWVPDRGANGA